MYHKEKKRGNPLGKRHELTPASQDVEMYAVDRAEPLVYEREHVHSLSYEYTHYILVGRHSPSVSGVRGKNLTQLR